MSQSRAARDDLVCLFFTLNRLQGITDKEAVLMSHPRVLTGPYRTLFTMPPRMKKLEAKAFCSTSTLSKSPPLSLWEGKRRAVDERDCGEYLRMKALKNLRLICHAPLCICQWVQRPPL